MKPVDDESWTEFIGNIERDVNGKQLEAYKMLKDLKISFRNIQ